MKIDRRSFISFIVGGAAGSALSPIPLKLTDDSSIWSQNWSWTPVPQEGRVSFENTICSLCPAGCGLTVRKIEDRVVKIEGLKGHPINAGGVCILGAAGPQILYGPSRIQSPMLKVKQAGVTTWKPVSWSRALSIVVDKLRKLRENDQVDKLACLTHSDKGTVPQLFKRFLTVFGSQNFFGMPNYQDAYTLVLSLMQGVEGEPAFDLENADYILSFGAGILEGWGSAPHSFQAHSSWENNRAQLVQIEPRLSNTAAKSDSWIPINPGTEAALALGIAHVIIEKKLYDKEFVNNYTHGFSDWKAMILKNYSPAQVESITGVEQLKIEEIAVAFTKSTRPLAVAGKGQGHTPGQIKEYMCVHALNALVGNINKKGGVSALASSNYIKWPKVNPDKIASAGLKTGRIDKLTENSYSSTKYLPHRLFQQVLSEKESPVDVLFVAECNPGHTIPDTKACQKALEKIPFVVSFSSFMDETAQCADIILPNHVFLERYQDVPTPPGFNKPLIGLSRPVVGPQFDTKNTGDVLIFLAKKLGGTISNAFPWNNYEECLKKTLKNKWATLIKKGYWIENGYKRTNVGDAFSNSALEFVFMNRKLNIVPEYVASEKDSKSQSFPLKLIPYDSMRLSSQYISSPPFLMKALEDTILKDNLSIVEINPITAEKFNLKNEKNATLSTSKGRAQVKVLFSEGIIPGVIALARGLGHTGTIGEVGYDKYIAHKGVNINTLMETIEDPIAGFDAAWGIGARLERA